MPVYYRLAAPSRPSQISTTFGLVTWPVVNACSCSRVVQGQPACNFYVASLNTMVFIVDGMTHGRECRILSHVCKALARSRTRIQATVTIRLETGVLPAPRRVD